MPGPFRVPAAAPAPAPAPSWTTWTPVDSTKTDPNTIEDAAPSIDGDGWVTVTLDTTTAYTAVGDLLAYLQELSVTWAQAWRLDLQLEVQQAAETDIAVAAVVSDSTTLTGADGVYVGTKEETAGNFDYYSRPADVAVPNAGSVAGDPIVAESLVLHGSGRLSSQTAWFDTSTTPPTLRVEDGSWRLDTGVPTTGAVYLGVMVASQVGSGGADRTVTFRLRYRLVELT